MASERVRPAAKEMSIALVCLVLVLGGAFAGASLTHSADLRAKKERPFFSLDPPCKPDVECNRTPFEESQRLDLHRTFFTAWAALVLITPALCFFWFRRTSESAKKYWLAFWTVSFVAFMVHFYWAVYVIFGGDWVRILDPVKNGGRVTVPTLDTVLTFCWGIDIFVAWLIPSEPWWIRIPRIIVHLVAFVLFFAGSFLEGDNAWSRALGLTMGVAVLISFLLWLLRSFRRRAEQRT